MVGDKGIGQISYFHVAIPPFFVSRLLSFLLFSAAIVVSHKTRYEATNAFKREKEWDQYYLERYTTASRGKVRNFCLGLSYNTNIFIKTISYIHINTHTFFIIYTLFYLISYIYTHTQQKKSLIYSIKIIFDGYFS